MEIQPVSEFKLDSKGLWRIRKEYLAWTAAFFLVIGAFTIFSPTTVTTKTIVNGAVTTKQVKETGFIAFLFNFVPLLFLFGVSVLFQGFSIRRHYKGMTIRINDDIIESAVNIHNRKIFYLNDIKNWGRSRRGTIHLYSKGQVIIIPREINQYDELLSLLQLKFPSLGKSKITFYHRYFTVLAFIGIVLFVSILAFDNKILLSVNGLLFMGLLSAEIRKRYKGYKITKSKEQRNFLLYELLIAAAALYVLIPKLIK